MPQIVEFEVSGAIERRKFVHIFHLPLIVNFAAMTVFS